jgi:hypothetical protein
MLMLFTGGGAEHSNGAGPLLSSAARSAPAFLMVSLAENRRASVSAPAGRGEADRFESAPQIQLPSPASVVGDEAQEPPPDAPKGRRACHRPQRPRCRQRPRRLHHGSPESLPSPGDLSDLAVFEPAAVQTLRAAASRRAYVHRRGKPLVSPGTPAMRWPASSTCRRCPWPTSSRTILESAGNQQGTRRPAPVHQRSAAKSMSCSSSGRMPSGFFEEAASDRIRAGPLSRRACATAARSRASWRWRCSSFPSTAAAGVTGTRLLDASLRLVQPANLPVKPDQRRADRVLLLRSRSRSSTRSRPAACRLAECDRADLRRRPCRTACSSASAWPMVLAPTRCPPGPAPPAFPPLFRVTFASTSESPVRGGFASLAAGAVTGLPAAGAPAGVGLLQATVSVTRAARVSSRCGEVVAIVMSFSGNMLSSCPLAPAACRPDPARPGPR